MVGRQEALEVARLKAETIYFAATHTLSQTFFPEWIRHAETNASGRGHSTGGGQFRGLRNTADRCGGAVHARQLSSESMTSRLDSDRFQRINWTETCWSPSARRRPRAWRASRKGRAALRIARHGHAPLPYLAYHPGSGVGRIVTSFLGTKEPPGASGPELFRAGDAADRHGPRGTGITWAPRSLVADDLAAGRLMRAGAEDWDIAINVCLFRSRSRLTPPAEAFWSAVHKGERGKASPAKTSRQSKGTS